MSAATKQARTLFHFIESHTAARGLRGRKVICLAGDSYPANPHIEDALRRRTAPFVRQWLGQQDLLDRATDGRFDIEIGRRLDLLRKEIPNARAASDVVLFGRSSGARVATLFATSCPVRAIICLGYPFRHPDREMEPDRFSHLADLRTPTLILQGDRDVYGSPASAEGLALSDQIRMRRFDGDHDLRLSEKAWDDIARHIRKFLLWL